LICYILKNILFRKPTLHIIYSLKRFGSINFMKKSIFYFGTLLWIVNSYSQNTIAYQSFENSDDTWLPLSFSTPPCSNNNDVWNYVSSLGGVNPSDGNQFWGIRKLDGSCGGDNFETITLPNIDISPYANVAFSFDYYADNFDNGEDLKYELFYDDISQGEVIVVNGVGGPSDNTNGWRSETVSILASVTNVSVVFSAKCNQGNETAGFDNVKLFNVPNDNCQGAEVLNVFDNGNSIGNETAANTLAAASSNMSLTSCNGSSSNEILDLFFTFTVPLGETSVNVLTSGTNGDTVDIAVYDGCNGNELICQTNDSVLHEITGLTSGATYILQAWHDELNAGPFNIALETLPKPLTNNDCLNATLLIVGNSNTENVVTGTNLNASDSGALPIPSCAFYNGNDVWFTAMVPPSGILTVETLNAGSNIDTGLAVYSGTCNNLTQVACDDDSGSGFYSTINVTGLPNEMVYIRVWAYDNSSAGIFNIVAYTPLCPSTTRWNNSNWSNGLPNSYTTAIINSNYDTAVNGSFESCNCQINNNQIINVRANDNITIHNDLTVDGTLEVRHEGSLVLTNDNGQVSVAGTLNIHKTTTPFNQYDYSYWSSPTANETIGDALVNFVANRIYAFNPSIYDELVTNGWTAVGGSTVMAPGVGYIAMGPETGSFPQTQDVIFDGIVNNGVIQTPITLSADNSKDYEDWNLIGNPYPSGIDAELLLGNSINRGIVGGTIYLWTHNTERNANPGEQDYNSGDYATYTIGTGGVAATSGGERPTGIIASGQSFFIDGSTNGNITFNNSMRVKDGNNQFFRSPESKSAQEIEQDKIWLNLFADNGAFNQLLIGFIEGATDAVESLYDGIKFGGGWVSFYSIIDDKNLTVNGKGTLTKNETIKLGFSSFVEEGDTLKISKANTEGKLSSNDYDIMLKDNLLEIIHDLNEGDYEFIINEKGVFNNRFELIINKTTISTIENELINNELIITHNETNLTIATTNDIEIISFRVYDMLGKLIIDESPNKSQFDSNIHNIRKGTVLLIKAVLDNNEVLTKKIILPN